MVRAVISIGLIPDVATLQEDEKFKLVTASGQNLEFHPRSCNRNIVKRVSSADWWFT